ncbi:unnamed protein product [Arctia plantaginis]|uniref:Uncharacterized protein n=1 Tax=Arctia plantaginis TaxID=874455 RepID=A0A8S0Z8Y4_ARCPL|nr:unnamed protein product [Arctia plantaginis]
MLLNIKFIVSFALITGVLESDSYRIFQRENNKKIQPHRDYRPNKWLANSAMDIWYGNKTFIDIIWQEFADLMYKLTDRAERSTGEYQSKKIQKNTTLPFSYEYFKLGSNNTSNESEQIKSSGRASRLKHTGLRDARRIPLFE